MDAASGRTLSSAQVSIPGTGRGGLTNADGRFLLLNVPVGERTVQIVLIGYGSQEQSVTVQSGQVSTLTFQLETSALELDEMVVTGTAGGTQRRAIGNVVTAINTNEIMTRSGHGTGGNRHGAAHPGRREHHPG